MTAYLDAIDPATWARAIAYVAIFMMCLFVSMEWRRGLRLLALAATTTPTIPSKPASPTSSAAAANLLKPSSKPTGKGHS